MAYVRKVGSQLLVLHGSRQAGTRNVAQRTLFSIRSQAEARAILGEEGQETAQRFRSLMEHAHPTVKFSWPPLVRAIRAHAADLPAEHAYRQERLLDRFRADLVSFTRQLATADPQSLMSFADTIRSHRAELEYVRDLITWRLEVGDPPQHEFNQDDRFFWRATLRGDDITGETAESFAGVLENKSPEHALAVGRLLLDAFPGWVEGHCHLGNLCADEADLPSAEKHFLACLSAASPRLVRQRGKLPWSHLQNRPYIRALRGLCAVHQRGGRHDDVLATCARLVKEAGDTFTASAYRSVAFLCRGQWLLAADAARALRENDPSLSLVHAFACAELGDVEEASISAIHGILNLPRVVRMLLLQRQPEPRTRSEVDEHNAGVWLWRMVRTYLAQGGPGPKLLKSVQRQPAVAAAVRRRQEQEALREAQPRTAPAAPRPKRGLAEARALYQSIHGVRTRRPRVRATLRGGAQA